MRSRLRVALAALAAALALVVVVAVPAEAGFALSKPQRATPNGCYFTVANFDTGGTGRGFAICPAVAKPSFGYVQGSGSTWRLTPTSLSGTLLNVTDDGSNTYVLFMTSVSPTRNDLKIAIRNRAGRITVATVRANTNYYPGVDSSLIAYRGRWWAVWTEPNGGCACNQLWTARTMLTPYSAHLTSLVGGSPALANRGNSAVLVWSDGYGVGGHIAIGFPTATGFTRSAPGWPGSYPSINASGGVLRVAYLSATASTTQVIYRDLVAGRWSAHTMAEKWYSAGPRNTINPGPPMIAVSGGATFVGWSTQRVTAGISYGVLAVKRNGSWTEALVTDGLTGRYGTVLASMGAYAGKAALLLTHLGGGLETERYDVYRRQV